MTKIKKLLPGLIASIAAGQVVERPKDIIKELVENSLDAKAKNIKIELESAGKKRIVVSDDGMGMSQDDLMLCFKHHTTSKIYKQEDLFSISSLGFRGEALSSIVSSANVRIESKTQKKLAGKYLELVDGKVKKFESIGMPTGTRIVVSGLFSNLPARKKFLKSTNTEFVHILQTITGLALAHCNVSFKLIHNKKTIFELPKGQTLIERANQLLSSQVGDNFLPIAINSEHFSLKGFLGKPQIGITSLNRQFVFVNGRSVHSKKISQTLKDVFSTLLEPRSYPAFLLNITLSSDLVDVNVDPKKSEVRFRIESEIINSLESHAKKVLDKANLTYNKKGVNGFYDEYLMDIGIAKIIKSHGGGWNIKDAELVNSAEILQIHDLYLVVQTKRGILIIDQHAAHERILYQEFLEKFNNKRSQFFTLAKPVKIYLPVAEAYFLENNLEIFKNLGFEINILKNNNLLIKKVPEIFKTRNISSLFQEILHDCIKNEKPKNLDVGSHRTISYLACRSAIKAGEKLTQNERKRLIEKLMKTKGKYTCPHGRPVEVELDINYLGQLFKRIK